MSRTDNDGVRGAGREGLETGPATVRAHPSSRREAGWPRKKVLMVINAVPEALENADDAHGRLG